MNTRRWGGGQRSWVMSILLHLAVLGGIFGLWYWIAQRPKPVESMGIEARVVTGDALESTRAPPPEPAPEPTPVVEQPPEPPPPPEPTGPTQEELAAQAAEQARVAEERRVAAEREVAERKAATEKAERDREEKERKEKERVAREKAEKAEKEKAEKAERERLAQQKAEQERAEKARQQREDELSAQLAAEERRAAARNSTAMAQYRALIQAKIERAWNKPPGARAGIECELRVTQTSGGTVTAAKVGRCNADDAVRQSIEAAAYRASPLPGPPDPALFERELIVTFRPTE